MDPNPIKHPAVVIAHIRDAIEPSIIGAGFCFDSRNSPPADGNSLWIDYARAGDTLSIRFDHYAGLTAELLDAGGRVTVLANVHLDGVRSTDELMSRMARFSESITTRVKQADSP
jgi:hypothetical protein